MFTLNTSIARGNKGDSRNLLGEQAVGNAEVYINTEDISEHSSLKFAM